MDKVDELLRKLEPILGNKAKKLWQWYQMSGGAASGKSREEFLRLLADRRARVDYREKIRLPPPAPDLTPGKYDVGTVLYPDQAYSGFGLTDQDLLRHVLIVGMTGTGKTNLVRHLLTQLRKHNRPFLVFDWKQNYRMLRKRPEFRNLRVIRLGDRNCSFHFNPLIPPPGIHPRHWMAIFIDVCKHAYFLGHGVEYFLRKAIDQLYQQHGVYDGGKRYPTFIELEKVLVREYVKGREMLWMSSAKRAVASLTFKGILREILNVQENTDLTDLLEQNVVIEMDNLATLEKTFIVEALILWLYHYKKSRGRSNKLEHVTVVEEAHHVLSARKERAEGEETIIETTIRMIREFGEGVVVVDQEPSKLSESVIANTSTKVCFNLGSGKDIAVMAGAMNMKPEEQRYIDKLRIGHAIVKMKDRFSEAIHVRVPLVKVNKVV